MLFSDFFQVVIFGVGIQTQALEPGKLDLSEVSM